MSLNNIQDERVKTQLEHLKSLYSAPMANASEQQDHLAFMEWARLKQGVKDVILHIANEYDGGKIKGHLRKRMGVRKGVSDFFIPLPLGGYHGLWIELKRKVGGKVSDEQAAWIELMNSLGYKAMACYGFDDAVKQVESYLRAESL